MQTLNYGMRQNNNYLDLMKNTLSFMLWPEPSEPVMRHNLTRPFYKRWFIAFVSHVLAKKKLELVINRKYSNEEKAEGRVWSGYADTMIGTKRLDNLQQCIETVLKEEIEGDLIETGVWRGGACIFMRAILAAYGVRDRKIFLADSFEGLPKPDSETYPMDKNSTIHAVKLLAVSQEDVERNFNRYGLLDEQVVFLKGWFKDTLPKAPIQKLAIMRLDGDMYCSTMQALENLYPKLSVGGYCIIDDYYLRGCRAAVDDYRRQNGICAEVKMADWACGWWRKEQ